MNKSIFSSVLIISKVSKTKTSTSKTETKNKNEDKEIDEIIDDELNDF